MATKLTNNSTKTNWWSKYFTRANVTDEEAAECGFHKGDYMQNGYNELFEDFVDAKPDYQEPLEDYGYNSLQLATNGNLYLNSGDRLYLIDEQEIIDILERYNQ